MDALAAALSGKSASETDERCLTSVDDDFRSFVPLLPDVDIADLSGGGVSVEQLFRFVRR